MSRLEIQYYDQIDGVAMGLYGDDTFTLFAGKNTATQFLHYLDNCHANIKFTVEFEDNGTIPFLDILIKRHSSNSSNNFSSNRK